MKIVNVFAIKEEVVQRAGQGALQHKNWWLWDFFKLWDLWWEMSCNPQHCPSTEGGLFAFSSQLAFIPHCKIEADPGSQQVPGSRKQSRCAFGP